MSFEVSLLVSTIGLIILFGLDILWSVKFIQKKQTYDEYGVLIKHKVNYKKIIINLIALPALISLPIITYLSTTPNIALNYPATEGIWDNYSKPIRVVFNVPIDKNRITTNINPEIKGKWEWGTFMGINKLTKEGLFYPEETLFPGTRVVVYITGIARLGLLSEAHEHGFVFDSPQPPEIIDALPKNASVEIKKDENIKLTLNKNINNLIELNYKFDPEVEFEHEIIDDKIITIKPKYNLSLNTKYVLSIEQRSKRLNLNNHEVIEYDNFNLIHQIEFETQKEPFLRAFSPRGSGVKSDSKVRVQFQSDMNRESVEELFEISPSIAGDFKWDNDRTFSFIPSEPLKKETRYTVKIKTGAKTISGLTLEKELENIFETLGRVKVDSFFPNNGEVRVNEGSDIKVKFNQEVDKQSAQDSFNISPGVNGDFSWDSNTLIFNPVNNLSYSTSYTVEIKEGVKSIDGIDSNLPFVSKFTVRTNEMIISMPLYYQPQYPVSFSCNIYTAKMALAWKGYNLDAITIISEIGNDDRQDSQGRWLGNPHQNFIGNADGSWGYGVYWEPIQKVFANRGINTEIKANWNVKGIAKSIEEGHPVIIWRYNGTSTDKNISWGVPGIYAINGQHGGVVTGFKGTSDNPTSFYINDPWFGLVWMDINTFDYYWSRLNRVGLVIY